MVHRKTAKRWGVAATELAVLLPILMFMCVVAVDWARIFYYLITIQYAARDGCYYATDYPGIYQYSSVTEAVTAQNTNLESSKTTLTGYSTSGSDPSTATYTSYDLTSNGGKAPATTGGTTTTFVKIQVTYQFDMVTKFPLLVFPNSTSISRFEIMRVAPLTPG